MIDAYQQGCKKNITPITKKTIEAIMNKKNLRT